MQLNRSTHYRNTARGFSILEVLISIAIIGIITALILIKYGAFNNSVLLKSQAYDIALNIREAQVFAASVRNVAANTAYLRQDVGLYFATGVQEYILFSDRQTTTPVLWNSGDQQLGLPYQIDSRFSIRSICVNNCATQVNNLTLSFKRPDFDAHFASQGGPATITDARITIGDTNGSASTRTITIGATGQITVQ